MQDSPLKSVPRVDASRGFFPSTEQNKGASQAIKDLSLFEEIDLFVQTQTVVQQAASS